MCERQSDAEEKGVLTIEDYLRQSDTVASTLSYLVDEFATEFGGLLPAQGRIDLGKIRTEAGRLKALIPQIRAASS